MAKKIFLDANVIISVVNKEYPLFPFSSRILSLTGKWNFELTTSPLCLAIAFYFAEKKHQSELAKSKIKLLSEHISVTENSSSSVQKALDDPRVLDFEDGLQYYSAVENKTDVIVTENVRDFYFAEIEVLNSLDFCKKYLF